MGVCGRRLWQCQRLQAVAQEHCGRPQQLEAPQALGTPPQKDPPRRVRLLWTGPRDTFPRSVVTYMHPLGTCSSFLSVEHARPGQIQQGTDDTFEANRKT